MSFRNPPCFHVYIYKRSSVTLPRSRPNTIGLTEPQQPSTSSSSGPDEFLDRLFSLFRSPPDTIAEIELLQCPRRHRAVKVAAVQDRHVLYVAPRPQRKCSHTQPAGTTTPVAASAQSRPLPWRTRFVLFLCCAPPQHADGH